MSQPDPIAPSPAAPAVATPMLGLPLLDDAAAARAARGMRAAQGAVVPPPAPARPSERQLRHTLAIYCRAWADLQSGARTEVTLTHFDLGRDFVFDRLRLAALEQQIERLQSELGMPVAARGRRAWA